MKKPTHSSYGSFDDCCLDSHAQDPQPSQNINGLDDTPPYPLFSQNIPMRPQPAPLSAAAAVESETAVDNEQSMKDTPRSSKEEQECREETEKVKNNLHSDEKKNTVHEEADTEEESQGDRVLSSSSTMISNGQEPPEESTHRPPPRPFFVFHRQQQQPTLQSQPQQQQSGSSDRKWLRMWTFFTEFRSSSSSSFASTEMNGNGSDCNRCNCNGNNNDDLLLLGQNHNENLHHEYSDNEPLRVQQQQEQKKQQRRQRQWLWFRRTCWILFGLALAFSTVLFILGCGKMYEQAQVRNGPDTQRLYYETSTVCAMALQEPDNSSDVVLVMQTLASVDEPWEVSSQVSLESLESSTSTSSSEINNNNNNTKMIAHCGACGACSNPNDVNLYDVTKTTLYKTSFDCAKHGIFRGFHGAAQCLQHNNVTFTEPCAKCWVENIMCDLRKCIFSCFLHALRNRGGGGSTKKRRFRHGNDENSSSNHTTSFDTDTASSSFSSEALNECTRCDEVRCGPAFIECAGANRRRVGILSDIERDASIEVCQRVQPKHWWQHEALVRAWQEAAANAAAADPL